MHIERHASLRAYNTFNLDVTANYLITVNGIGELRYALTEEGLKHLDRIILGGGSNVLFTKDVPGLVVLNRIKGIEVVQEDNDYVLVKSGSGEVWNDLVMWSIERGLGGVENLSLIPGSVGAGPMQNIGAYGVELKDSFYELEAMDLQDLEIRKFSAEDCKFGYRESVFKHELRNRFYITSVTLKLHKHPLLKTTYGAITQELQRKGIISPVVRDISDAVISIRRSKLPDTRVLGNAGSFFKNPEVEEVVYEKLKQDFPDIVAFPVIPGKMKLAAGWLIEQCGWKGKVLGHCGAHKDQALVLVNYGGATGKEIYELALAIRDSVIEKFGVRIDPEVNVY